MRETKEISQSIADKQRDSRNEIESLRLVKNRIRQDKIRVEENLAFERYKKLRLTDPELYKQILKDEMNNIFYPGVDPYRRQIRKVEKSI